MFKIGMVLKGHLGASCSFLEIFSDIFLIKVFLAFYFLFLSTNSFLKMPYYTTLKISNLCQKERNSQVAPFFFKF